jgi:hypothetical protein
MEMKCKHEILEDGLYTCKKFMNKLKTRKSCGFFTLLCPEFEPCLNEHE